MGGREEGGQSVRAMKKGHAPRYRDASDPLGRIPRCSRGFEHPILVVGDFRVTFNTGSTFSVVYGRWQVVTDSEVNLPRKAQLPHPGTGSIF